MATTIFQQGSQLRSKLLTESKLAVFARQLDEHKLNFDRTSPDSLFAKPEFSSFLDEIVDASDELINNPQNQTVPIRFNALFEANDAAEEKDVIRDFLNLLFTEINYKNPEIFSGIQRYLLKENQTPDEEVEERDKNIRDYLIKEDSGIRILREINEKLVEETRQEETKEEAVETAKEEVEEKKEETHEGGMSGHGFQKKAQNAVQAEAQAATEVAEQGTTNSSLDIQKLAAQEGWRDSSALMDDILNSAFEVSDWRALYNSLPADQQRKLDFQLYSIQEDLAGVISLHLQSNPEFALLLSQSQRLSITDRIKIRSALTTQVGEIYNKLTRHEYFMMKTEVLKEGLGLQAAFDPSHFKGAQQTAQDATKLFTEKQDSEETGPKNYSVLQQKEFKRQLKELAVFNNLISEQSLENISSQILREYPGASKIDITDFNLLFQGETNFSLGIEERQKLLKEVNSYLGNLQSDGKTIDPGNFESFKKFKGFEKDNPKEALASLLKAYGIDGVSEKNIRNSLDAYVLSLGSPHLLSENLKGVLNTIDPRLRNSSEMMRILESYVAERKYVLADYTGNNLMTYSLEPEAETPLAFTTEQYRGMIVEYSKRYEGDTDKILAHAFFNRELANIPDDTSEQERYYREEAKKVRDSYLKELEKNILAATAVEKEYYAQLFGVDGQQFHDEAEYNNALFNGALQYQPWNAPQVGGGAGMAPGLGNLRNWLGRAKSLSKINVQSLRGVATNLASSQVKKGVVVAGAGAGAGLAIYGLITNLVQGVAGSTLGGIAGGAVAGGAIGSIFPVVGTGVGALVGGVGGGILGFIKGLSDSGSSGAVTSATTAARSLVSNAGQSAFNSASSGLTSVANAAANTLTASTASISASTSAVAVVVPLATVGILTILTTEMILSTFLPDASTIQVAPYFSLDIEQSRYVVLKKVADPSNAATPGSISYTISLSKKEDATEEIVITGFKDTPSAIDKDSNSIDAPTVPPEVLEQLNGFVGKTLAAGETLEVNFQIDASDPRFQDSLVKNDIMVEFTADGVTDESTSRAQTCFGDCPQTVLPACWPTLGSVWQPPCATGTKANPTYNPNATFSHHNLATGACLDAYDVGAPIGQPVYAMAPGTIIFAEMDPRTVANPGSGYGNLIKIDHGGFITFYAHQNQFEVSVGDTVQGGQLIGHVGMNGFSSGPHLHFEVVGLQEFLFQDLFGISGKSVPTNGPRCDEYYGNTQ